MEKVHEKPVFLLSCRRSGTTLLQRILNSHEKLTVWGEHGGFLKPLNKSFYDFIELPIMKEIRNQEEDYSSLIGELSTDKPIFWHNSLDQEHLIKCYREFIISLFTKGLSEDIYWGFKEIRYGLEDRVPRTLHTLFPGARFILLFRDPKETIESAIGAWHKKELAKGDIEKLEELATYFGTLWKKQNLYFKQFYSQGFEGKVFIMSYDELMESPERTVKTLFEFLELDFSQKLLSPMSTKLDSGRSQNSFGILQNLLVEMPLVQELDGIYQELLELRTVYQ